ncbi:MAG: hypothetical protein ABJA67_00540 [Chthonomonadales bacterium]
MFTLFALISLLNTQKPALTPAQTVNLRVITFREMEVGALYISSSGDVVCSAHDPDYRSKTSEYRALIWSNGKIAFPAADPQKPSQASTMNKRSETVGYTFFEGYRGTRACIWRNGSVRNLGTFANGGDSSADWINDHGDIVGTATDANQHQHAAFWSKGKLTDLGTLRGNESFASCITNNGIIVGTALLNDDDFHPFVYKAGKMWDMFTNSKWSHGGASHINDRQEVVGHLMDGGYHKAFYWKNGKFTVLPTLGGNASATCINNHGLIVGQSEVQYGKYRACLWRKGVAYDLNKLVPAAMDIHLTDATGINDKGQIAGIAYKRKNIPGKKYVQVGFVLQLPTSLLK